MERPNGPQHRVQGSAEVAVGPVAEALEVDLVERDVGADVVEHLWGGVAVRDVGAEEAGRLGEPEHLDRPFARDEGLVVGRGEDAGPAGEGRAHDFLRLHRLRGRDRGLVAQRL